MLRHRTFCIAAAAAALAACAGNAPRGGPGAAQAKADDESNALYQRLDEDSRRYEAGLALARSGETARAQAEMKAALDDLRAAATQCAQVKECDEQRFVAGFDSLLRAGIGSPSDLAVEGDTSATTPEATGEVGEGSPVVTALPQLGRSVTLLKGRELGDIIALNGPVKAALEEWLTQYRPNLMTAYENYQYLRYQMWPEYEKAGLPEALLFGMLAKESGGKVHAVSRSGASGPLQFMYATGLRFGLTTVDGFDQRFDPRLAARANAAYVNEQLAIFNNNLELVIGAYNGGEGAMQRRAGRGENASGFWSPEVYGSVSQETREYVPMVLAAAWLFMHPERYNLEFPKIAAKPGSITLKRPASIAELTVCLGQDGNAHDGWFRTLRNLNPQLDPQQQEPVGARLVVPQRLEKVYERDCAAGRWPELAAELHEAIVPAPPPVALAQSRSPGKARAKDRTYIVRKGDTLAAIARRSGHCGIREIAAANGLRGPHYPIKPGQALKVPECPR
ncbi:transglycosylase SLT domain-containing protein [Dokdonella fugitiva]|jgi:membrane-bound lytic murein transglycosylase D|uniref:transglycosylase SLT domain-containing protein n=1 Tax=Dokdonella fugitiva TaxID=328517 RepID=UPI0015F8A2DD|nr:transglycosylase SLT domain-containing protein [Dokdonella fugitiva]MBA8885500.1 membrane-bound lytic murein transglycosylase D [Dokdonella fugitiva]